MLINDKLSLHMIIIVANHLSSHAESVTVARDDVWLCASSIYFCSVNFRPYVSNTGILFEVWLFIKLYLNDCEFFHDWFFFFNLLLINWLINWKTAFSWWEITIGICITDWCLISVLISIHSNTYIFF